MTTSVRRLATALVLLVAAAPAFGLTVNHDFFGFWTLNVEKSVFGDGSKPRAGLVNWTERGWVFAIVNSDGSVYADALVLDNGCTLIGVPSSYSCEVSQVSPTHLRVVLREGDSPRRVGDIELLDNNTTRATHRVTPAQGEPYTEVTVWARE